ncbi:hypothetical protein O0I10_005052 [Lichtheimia ornata]|uniref:YncI copper-binding domain-containing protein n=1 Tax=Lichtheimia ornata TaxID=688661 RepID=A0AAD7V5E0_9FUNG|nr:uncharacterized protein O0I10_005052 [Lichtheimia ornata]KAJ8659337.1 hypothetical protein O0I10_005052 [Lichtheimia ornata]
MVAAALSSIALMLTAIGGAFAHAEFSVDEALPGSVLNTSIGIGHGCNGSNTIELAVSVPKEVTNIQALEVENWNLTLTHRTDNSSQVSNITWSGGNLDAHQYQGFGLIIDIPNVDVSQHNVTLLFPTIQKCENATNAWVAAEETETEKPAPKLTITKEVTPQPSSSSSDSQGNQDGESSASRLLTGLSLGAASAVLGSALLF